MDLSYVITRGVTMADRILWLLVIGQGSCSTSGLSPDDWYPVSVPAAAAKREDIRAGRLGQLVRTMSRSRPADRPAGQIADRAAS